MGLFTSIVLTAASLAQKEQERKRASKAADKAEKLAAAEAAKIEQKGPAATSVGGASNVSRQRGRVSGRSKTIISGDLAPKNIGVTGLLGR